MIKYYCDRCGEEAKDKTTIRLIQPNLLAEFHACPSCARALLDAFRKPGDGNAPMAEHEKDCTGEETPVEPSASDAIKLEKTRKLSIEQKRGIVRAIVAGKRCIEVSREYGCSQSMVAYVCNKWIDKEAVGNYESNAEIRGMVMERYDSGQTYEEIVADLRPHMPACNKPTIRDLIERVASGAKHDRKK